MDSNFLIGTLPASIGLMNLSGTLSIGYNQLTGTIPATLGNLNNLTQLEDAEGRVWTYRYDAVYSRIELHGPEFLMERKLQGSNMGSNRFRVDMPRFVDFYLQGRLHLDDMISRRIKLEDINDGLAALETGEVARSVIMFE